MPVELGVLLNTLAKSVGIEPTDPALVDFLSKAELATATIGDDIAKKITNGLLSIEAAKQNPDLKSHFTALALNAVDTELNELANEFGFDDTTKAELAGEKSSYKRAGLLARKVQQLEAAKVGAKEGDKSKLALQIDELNSQITEIKNGHSSELDKITKAHKAERIDWELNSLYNGYDYAMPLSKEANTQVAKNLINSELKAKGLSIVNQDNALKLLTSEGTEYYHENQKVGIKDFMDKTLTANKVLKIDDRKQDTPKPGEFKRPEGSKESTYSQQIAADIKSEI